MAEALMFDTTFLIDLQRERLIREKDRPAHAFLRLHGDAQAEISTIALGEYAEGFAGIEDPAFAALKQAFVLRPVDEETAYRYAALVRDLRGAGRLIGSNDLWIAASALRHGRGLVTRNARDFARIPGLRVVPY